MKINTLSVATGLVVVPALVYAALSIQLWRCFPQVECKSGGSMTRSSRPVGVNALILFHLFNIIIWLIGQTLAVFSYDMVAELGLQEPRELLNPAIVETNRAIGLTDTLIMLPLFCVALFGLLGMRFYGAVASWLVLGLTLYWPVIFWTAQFFYATAGIQHAPTAMINVLLPGTLWVIAAWGIFYLYRNRGLFD